MVAFALPIAGLVLVLAQITFGNTPQHRGFNQPQVPSQCPTATSASIASNPWNDVGHQVGVDPVDEACIHVNHLKQGGHLGVPGTAIDPDDIRHSPVASVFNDHGHPRTDVEKDGLGLGSFDTTRMINRHPSPLSTGVLAEEV